MKNSRLVHLLLILSAAAGVAVPRLTADSPSPYAPYAFLIGRWDIAPESGGPAVARSHFRWGPNQSYIWYETSLLQGGAETPHFEGMLVWNGVRGNLDMLLVLDVERGGGTQEQGTVSVQADGTVVREITAAYSPRSGAAGKTAQFRQTYKPAGPDRVLTSILRKSGDGWVATFPGSDRFAMIRYVAPR